MAVGVGASGFVGIAIETVQGTYTAPTHYMLLRGESLNYTQENVMRRPLRGNADLAGMLAGYIQVSGDIDVEVTEDILPVILRAARGAQAVTGTTPKVYTFVPNSVATPAQTLSITVVRNGVVFGYTGCVVISQTYGLNDNMLTATFGILGRDEAVQSAPTVSYVTTVPYGPGNFDIQIPTATAVFDTDTFEISIDDAGEAQNRLKLNSRAMAFAKFGERTVNVTVERDFESRAEYDAYKALTAQSITILASKGANASVKFTIPAAIKETYEISGLSGQAELIRASVSYVGTFDTTTSRSYEIVSTTTATITVP